MSTTMTQNQPTPTYIRRTGGGGNPPGGGPPPGGGFFSGGFRPLGGGPPGGGGGGPPGGNPGGQQAAAQNPGQGGSGGKLQGKEPQIFTGDKNQSEEFQLKWDIYVALNHSVEIVQVAFTRAVMFLSYIKGPNVHEWVQSRVCWLVEQLTRGALQSDKYLYWETHTAFQNTFTDTMTMQKAKNEIQNLKMKDGDVDGYTARFEQLCRLGNYNVNDEAVIDMYRRGLYPKLQVNVIQNERPFTYHEWVRGAQRQQKIYLQVRSILGERPNQGKTPNNWNQNRTQEQWRNAFSKNNQRKDPNTMDTSADRIRAQQITMDERQELMKAGKCFTCKKQGHLSCDCPQKVPYVPRARTAQTDDATPTNEEPAVRTGKTKYSADEIIEIMQNANEGDKDEVIQKVFMKSQDFS
jgi:hypothetical protein